MSALVDEKSKSEKKKMLSLKLREETHEQLEALRESLSEDLGTRLTKTAVIEILIAMGVSTLSSTSPITDAVMSNVKMDFSD